MGQQPILLVPPGGDKEERPEQVALRKREGNSPVGEASFDRPTSHPHPSHSALVPLTVPPPLLPHSLLFLPLRAELPLQGAGLGLSHSQAANSEKAVREGQSQVAGSGCPAGSPCLNPPGLSR